MLHILERFRRTVPGFNRREWTLDDCREFCRRRKIPVKSAPLLVRGYMGKTEVRRRPRNYIFLDSRLAGPELLRTFLHEIGHILLHEPRGDKEVLYLRRENSKETKQDSEADVFMLLTMFPKKKFLELSFTPFDDIHPALHDLLKRRQNLYEKFGE